MVAIGSGERLSATLSGKLTVYVPGSRRCAVLVKARQHWVCDARYWTALPPGALGSAITVPTPFSSDGQSEKRSVALPSRRPGRSARTASAEGRVGTV